MECKKFYIEKQYDVALTNLITGISAYEFGQQRAVVFAKKLIDHYLSVKEKNKVLAILNNLALDINQDVLSQDSLKSWYHQMDTIDGLKRYEMVEKKLSGITYFISEQNVKLPENWNFISHAVPSEKLRTAKYILIDFWYSGCIPCIAEVPGLNKFYDKIKNRSDIIFLSVNTDFVSTQQPENFIKEIIKKNNINFPVVYDNAQTNLSKQLNVYGYPAKFILTIKGENIIKSDNSSITLDTFYNYLKTSND